MAPGHSQYHRPGERRNTIPERVFNRILVATLGRPWSVHALELAVRLAKADGLELVVVAVLTPGYVPEKHAAWGIALSAGVGQNMKALAEHVLETARSLAEANGLTYVCEMREGRAADEILKAAEEHKCDVIVIRVAWTQWDNTRDHGRDRQ